MSIEDRYLSGLVAVQFPDAPVDDSVQLAAGPSDTVSDAGTGVRVGRAGVKMKPPSMEDITVPAKGMLDMGAATLKGATQGFIGLPGDLEGIGRLVLGAMGVNAGEKTVLPTTDEVKVWLDKNVGQVGNGQIPYESMGEVVAPGGQVKAVKAAGRGAKALAPKAAEMVVNATEKTGMPVRGLGIVEPSQAMATNVKVKLPSDPVFEEAVGNTPGAQITEDGLLMDVVRFQKPEQEGDAAIRTGVFYLPSGAATAKHYKTGKTGYGGTDKFEGQTLIRSPLFVKGATGGKAPEVAYDQIKGKKAYQDMRDEVLKSYGYNSNEGQKVEAVQALLVKFNGLDETDAYDQAYMIVRNSKTGNTLPYAVQENIVAHAVREAGYDAVVGYSKGKAGANISEVFDVREQTFPARDMQSEIHDSFAQ